MFKLIKFIGGGLMNFEEGVTVILAAMILFGAYYTYSFATWPAEEILPLDQSVDIGIGEKNLSMLLVKNPLDSINGTVEVRTYTNKSQFLNSLGNEAVYKNIRVTGDNAKTYYEHHVRVSYWQTQSDKVVVFNDFRNYRARNFAYQYSADKSSNSEIVFDKRILEGGVKGFILMIIFGAGFAVLLHVSSYMWSNGQRILGRRKK